MEMGQTLSAKTRKQDERWKMENKKSYLGSQSSSANQQRKKGEEWKQEVEEVCRETDMFIGSYNLINMKGFVCVTH